MSQLLCTFRRSYRGFIRFLNYVPFFLLKLNRSGYSQLNRSEDIGFPINDTHTDTLTYRIVTYRVDDKLSNI